MKTCSHCNGKSDNEGPICALCVSIGVARVLCEECGRDTKRFGFPSEMEGAVCDDCLLEDWI